MLYMLKALYIFLGESCKKCNCSGNINPDDPASCNSITGECMRCLNNTYGAACNLCAPGYHGDAIVLKDCRSKRITKNSWKI